MTLSTTPAPGPTPPARRRRWRFSIAALLVAVVAMAGLSVWMYPTAAAWFHQKEQSRIVGNSVAVVDENADRDAAALKAAREYNDALTSGAVFEANKNIASGSGTSSDRALDYAKLLDEGSDGLMARLQIPGIDLDLPVYHGTSDETLLKGLGHLEGTSLPVGGAGTHSVITGHRGLAEATMFTHLDQVKMGDTFTISTFGEVLTYRVTGTQVVDPDQTKSLRPVSGQDLVTLVTCTPLGINSQRIFVTGQRVFPTPAADLEAAAGAPDVPGFPWWAVALGGGLLVTTTYVWWAGRPPHRR